MRYANIILARASWQTDLHTRFARIGNHDIVDEGIFVADLIEERFPRKYP